MSWTEKIRDECGAEQPRVLAIESRQEEYEYPHDEQQCEWFGVERKQCVCGQFEVADCERHPERHDEDDDIADEERPDDHGTSDGCWG